MEEIEIRVDDVLVSQNLTHSMCNSRRYNTFFGHFKEMDKMLQKLKRPVVLTIMAEGIYDYPEWIEYIKKNLHRYKLELHGYSHYRFEGWTEEGAFQSLSLARSLIEETFGVKVTRWYVPFGRMHFPSWSQKVCTRMGLEFHTGEDTNRQFYFHYWNSRDRLRLQRLMEKYGIK